MEKQKIIHASEVAQLVRNNNIIVKRITSNPVPSEIDLQLLEKIKIETDGILAQNMVIDNMLSVDTIAMLNDTKFRILDENAVAFSYTPKPVVKEVLPEKTYTNISGDFVIAKHENVSAGKAMGNTESTLGIIDDLTNYKGEPTLFIGKSKSGNPGVATDVLHNINISDEYKIAFDFTLNRFPSKVYQDTKQHPYSIKPANMAKKYTTRRADLISFNYGPDHTENTVQFGVMAPYGLNPDGTNRFDNYYDEFSIAACINHETNKKISLFTDYKFRLGETYHVLLKIKMISADYLYNFDVEIEKCKKAKSDNIVFDGVHYTAKTATEQLDIWSRLFSKSESEYEQLKNVYDILSTEYLKAVTDRSNEFQVYYDSKSDGVYYNIEQAKHKLRSLDEILDNQDYFGYRGIYDISLFINGEREQVVTTNNKVWGKAGKIQKIKELIPSAPSFLYLHDSASDKAKAKAEAASKSRAKAVEAEKAIEYRIGMYKFPQFVDDIINTRINREIKSLRTGKKIEELTDYNDYWGFVYQRLTDVQKLIISDIQSMCSNLEIDHTEFLANYWANIRDNRNSETFSPVDYYHITPSAYDLEYLHYISKKMKRLGVMSKIISNDAQLEKMDNEHYSVDVRIINNRHVEGNYPILYLYKRFTDLQSDETVLRMLNSSPTTIQTRLSLSDAKQFKQECEDNKFAGVVLKPKLVNTTNKTKFSNKLGPNKVSVPVYTSASLRTPGIFPHYIVIEKFLGFSRKPVVDIVNSYTVALNKVDFTKLYSIYSTPYIIKQQ